MAHVGGGQALTNKKKPKQRNDQNANAREKLFEGHITHYK